MRPKIPWPVRHLSKARSLVTRAGVRGLGVEQFHETLRAHGRERADEFCREVIADHKLVRQIFRAPASSDAEIAAGITMFRTIMGLSSRAGAGAAAGTAGADTKSTVSNFLLPPHVISSLLYDFLQYVRGSRSLTHLGPIRAAAYRHILPGPLARSQWWYLGTAVQVLLNCGQDLRAQELFGAAFSSHGGAVLRPLPTTSFLRSLARGRDWTELARWLREIHATAPEIIPPELWADLLAQALDHADQNVTAAAYDCWIMAENNKSLSDPDAAGGYTAADAVRRAYESPVSGSVLARVLRVFSAHGDVDRCVALVESHHVHRGLEGDRAVLAAVCADLVAAYCYSAYDAREKMARVLGVVDVFVRRHGPALAYVDVAPAMSHAFMTSFDAGPGLRADDEVKTTNHNIHTTPYGNSLARLASLDRFVADCFALLRQTNAHTATYTLFVNCVLHHVGQHQNFGGVVAALEAVRAQLLVPAHEWLDRDSARVVVHAVSNSTAGKLASLVLFRQWPPRAADEFAWLIEAALRGSDFYALVEYYTYRYLKYLCASSEASGAEVDPCVAYVFSDYADGSARFAQLRRFVLAPGPVDPARVDEFWAKHRLNKAEPEIVDDGLGAPRRYNYAADVQNAKRLQEVLGVKETRQES